MDGREKGEREGAECMHIHVDLIYSDSVFFFFSPTSFLLFSRNVCFRGCI